MRMKKSQFLFGLFFMMMLTFSLSSLFGQQRSRAEIAWDWIYNAKALVIDVRTPEEFNSGHLDMAINIPLDTIEKRITAIVPNKTASIVLYCRSGNRSGQAYNILKSLGYTRIHNGGGYTELLQARPKK
ncbi:rhodanese-like domain-containing protein [Gracilinema caldarium]|uniref:rhodanese-like domain-containing protein n=1 Tax=Gracilinema caldarium TaxID=215591 RepID=UPI0026EEB389|nr:rhodanese-like domain-containing protein [Gracilinema caldarium]